MRFIVSCTLTFLIAIFIVAPKAEAISDDESIKMLTDLVHAYYNSDAVRLIEICHQFKNRQFEDVKTTRSWMKERVATKETYMKVRGVPVYGIAEIISEEVGDIEFRFDGTDKSPSRVVVVTAWVGRVYKFDDAVPEKHRIIEQSAVLKIYVTIVKEKYLSFKSDEINFGYYFASEGGAPEVTPTGHIHSRSAN